MAPWTTHLVMAHLVTAHLAYALAWASFGAGHSLLATPRARAWMRTRCGHAYRLAYNAIATVHIGAVLAVGHGLLGSLPGDVVPSWARYGLNGLTVTGAVLFLWALRYYDTGLLTGLRQIREGAGRGGSEREDSVYDDEPLHLAGPHRLVRHPLYATGMLLLWGQAVDPLGVATAVWGSVYLVVGAAFEERKLLRHYGAAYAAYRRRVPAFVPWRGLTPRPPNP